MQIFELTEIDLLARMKNFEDHLVERKTIRDQKDWKKTVVAFANSVPVGLPAVLYIGVKDNGEIETRQENLDEVQKKFNGQMQRLYPRVPYVSKIISDNGRQALAVIIPGSELRPHFAGLSYVRRGSETYEAAEQEFAELIAQRNSKTARILSFKGKAITAINRNPVQGGQYFSETLWGEPTIVTYCDQFYVTLGQSTGSPTSFPLSRVEINFDNARNRLQLEILR
jgi:hypothetical protein